MDCYREGSVNVLLLLEARPTSVASIQTHDGGVSHNMAGHVIVHYVELTYCTGPSFPLLHKTSGCSLEDKLDRQRKHWFIC